MLAGQKIFGVGLNKTGTTTLRYCGLALGLKCKGCDRGLLKAFRQNHLDPIRESVAHFDLFEDWPWPLAYQQLDQWFPGSKFILTVRQNEHKWLESLKSHAMRSRPFLHCRKLAYGHGYPQGHEADFLAFYQRHNQAIRDYFAQRPDDFLEICWENGDGFDRLCTFLELPIPQVEVPHLKKGSDLKPHFWREALNRFLCHF